MRVGLRFAVASALLATFGMGCACVQQRKPWSTGALTGAAFGAIGGAVAGGAGANNGGAFDVGRHEEDIAVGAISGAVGGGILGALIGHCLWDPEPPPPPPPPPPAPEPTPVVKQKIVLRGVNFDFDKATIRPDAEPVLQEAATILQENAGVAVSVNGHTDSVGTDAYNQGLSERRAESVKTFLVEQGVDGARLTTQGFGESQPVASNETDDGRAQNRRVELKPAD